MQIRCQAAPSTQTGSAPASSRVALHANPETRWHATIYGRRPAEFLAAKSWLRPSSSSSVSISSWRDNRITVKMPRREDDQGYCLCHYVTGPRGHRAMSSGTLVKLVVLTTTLISAITWLDA